MTENKKYEKDLGLMIVSGGIILMGVIGLFFDLAYGSIGILVGVGMFAMSLLGNKPIKKEN